MKKALVFLLCLAIPLTIGGVSGFATVTGIDSWYSSINKPSFNPPNWIFAPVWTTLYALMGVSLFLIWQSPASQLRTNALIIFGIQLFLNFCWSFLFFYFESPGLALIEIVFLWGSILMMIFYFIKVKPIAGYLQIPYILWVSFASILNAAIWHLN
ncbi:TspO/MBR family protein [Jiulongibacter sediminis]|jgi:tryptophan-rich sensory protein|uniref:TspO/MBR family protein n=1 Tax=Jiulongibacter sediminis TaxID=1605367 RepID=UPI0026ED2B49|nr:TspO/MBR family protein [Jiulongibacter sediminis]